MADRKPFSELSKRQKLRRVDQECTEAFEELDLVFAQIFQNPPSCSESIEEENEADSDNFLNDDIPDCEGEITSGFQHIMLESGAEQFLGNESDCLDCDTDSEDSDYDSRFESMQKTVKEELSIKDKLASWFRS